MAPERTPEQEEARARRRAEGLAKARRTRERALAKLRVQQRREIGRFHRWLHEEHEAYLAMVQGGRSPALVAAWRKVWRAKPVNLPDDSVWRAMRGETGDAT